VAASDNMLQRGSTGALSVSLIPVTARLRHRRNSSGAGLLRAAQCRDRCSLSSCKGDDPATQTPSVRTARNQTSAFARLCVRITPSLASWAMSSTYQAAHASSFDRLIKAAGSHRCRQAGGRSQGIGFAVWKGLSRHHATTTPTRSRLCPGRPSIQLFQRLHFKRSPL
jgi:hypothetical protein